jgi:hypothetical protein
MKKLVLITAVIACAAMVMAQTVTSQNIVGYSKGANTGLELGSAQFFVGTGNTVTEIFGDQLPVGSKIYKYDPVSGYVGNIATYSSVFLGGTAWSPELSIAPGEAYWVETAGAAPSITAGEVPLDDSVTNNIVPGLQLLSYPYPVQVSISQMEFTPTVGDKIYKYDPVTGYVGNISTFSTVFLGGTAWSTDITFDVGDGFWYESAAGGTVQWIVNRPFTP